MQVETSYRNQDFSTSLEFEDMAAAFKKDSSIFDEKQIYGNLESFLAALN
ncbi:MAG: hypothetical protein IKF78_03855 [Atopobiaceae bacterium]|nr:hypothetical protein [Atopobiaceae bacterium]